MSVKDMRNYGAINRRRRRMPAPAQSSRANVMIGCTVRNCGGAGVFVGPHADVVIDGLVSEDNGGPGLQIAEGSTATSARSVYRRNGRRTGEAQVDNHGRFDSYGDQIG
jgi:hypothetical protein